MIRALRCILFARLTRFDLIAGCSLGMTTLVGGLWLGVASLSWWPL